MSGNTRYYLTEPKVGTLARAFANGEFYGKTELTSAFSGWHGMLVTVNASTFDVEKQLLRGVNYNDGKVNWGEQEIYGRTYLIITPDKKLTYSNDPTKEKDVDISLLGFFPIIVDSEIVISKFDEQYPYKGIPNPQQIIYQYEDGQIGFLTVEGRVNKQRGLTIEECADILIERNVKFAYLLDGGGSTTTCINGLMVNTPSDATGERPVKDFLYFKE